MGMNASHMIRNLLCSIAEYLEISDNGIRMRFITSQVGTDGGFIVGLQLLLLGIAYRLGE